jgi:hypothetical protein
VDVAPDTGDEDVECAAGGADGVNGHIKKRAPGPDAQEELDIGADAQPARRKAGT